MENELIVIRQLPIIEEQLRTVQKNIQDMVDEALAMECNEDTVKAVKKVRAELNSRYRELEARRKEVKAKIEAPYKEFEAIYKSCAGDLFEDADKQLSEKIKAVEGELKRKKTDAVRSFFEEYRDSIGVSADIATFENFGIKVNMSTTEKSAKAECRNYLDRIMKELELISTLSYADEILVEYTKTMDVYKAIQTVTDRHSELERMRQARENFCQEKVQNERHDMEVQQIVKEEEENQEQYLSAPVVKAPLQQEKLYEVSFTVRGTLEELKALKQFMNDGGYHYEQNKRNDTSAA